MLKILNKSPGALSKLGSDGVISVVDALVRQSQPPPVAKPPTVSTPAPPAEPPLEMGVAEGSGEGQVEAEAGEEAPSLKARIKNMRAAIDKDLPAPSASPPPPP